MPIETTRNPAPRRPSLWSNPEFVQSVARLGGDEFCVLLIDCDLDTATKIAESIREQVHEYRLVWRGRSHSVGTSIGVAASDSLQDGQSLLRLADAACHAARNQGRNSVHVVKPHQRIADTSLLRGLPDVG